MSFSSLPRRSSSVMFQSSSTLMPYQFANNQLAPHRRPTIGAPDVVLTAQPSASLKRRGHIRRTSRSGNSPTESTFSTMSQPVPKPKPEPLITAFTRNISASTATITPSVTRRPTLTDPMAVEWRDAPSYQPNVSAKAEISRRSTMASVYSMPSVEGEYSSRRPTQDNCIHDWGVVERALQNRSSLPSAPSRSSQDAVFSNSSLYFAAPSDLSRSSSRTTGLSRSNTTHVQSLLLERRSKYEVLPESSSE